MKIPAIAPASIRSFTLAGAAIPSVTTILPATRVPARSTPVDSTSNALRPLPLVTYTSSPETSAPFVDTDIAGVFARYTVPLQRTPEGPGIEMKHSGSWRRCGTPHAVSCFVSSSNARRSSGDPERRTSLENCSTKRHGTLIDTASRTRRSRAPSLHPVISSTRLIRVSPFSTAELCSDRLTSD